MICITWIFIKVEYFKGIFMQNIAEYLDFYLKI